ncbi:MAG: hypothetical protein WCD89_09230 [Anaerocolumna sp.]
MSIRAIMLPGAVAGLLAGCASDALQPPAYEAPIKAYYEAHASERNGRCLAPYIDGFTRVEVVEDNAEQLVIQASYLYRDWLKDQVDSEDGNRMSECVAYNSRRFVLTKSDAGLQVAEMGPSQRGECRTLWSNGGRNGCDPISEEL